MTFENIDPVLYTLSEYLSGKEQLYLYDGKIIKEIHINNKKVIINNMKDLELVLKYPNIKMEVIYSDNLEEIKEKRKEYIKGYEILTERYQMTIENGLLKLLE